MGVSIMMRPGSIMRSKGKPVNITPGHRSRAADALVRTFGSFPMELHADDEETLKMLARGAEPYSMERTIWDELLDGVREHGVVTVMAEY